MADVKPTAALEEQKPVAEQAPELPTTAPVAEETAQPKEAVAEPEVTPKATETEAAAAPAAIAVPEVKDEEAKVDDDVKPAAAETPAAAAAAAAAGGETAEAKADEPAVEATISPIQQLYAAFQGQSHPEIYGVTLADPDTHVPSQIVFQKFLNANDGDAALAKDQLLKTLAWRAENKPLELVKKTHSKAKFAGLGYVTAYGDAADPEKHAVFTWNVYGAASDRMSETFGDLDEFINWRVALAELALARLDLPSATRPITAESDPYKIYQVHDYLSISFLRRSAEVKASSSKTVAVFNQNYPETLKEKFFVNVPALMGFMYAFMKLFVAAKTLAKFHPMANGANLAGELKQNSVEGLAEQLPAAYGGKGQALEGNAEEVPLA